MIVGYARVSTEHDKQTISVEAQVKQFWELGCDYVIEERKSAFSEKVRRRGWEELQALVASGRVRKVIAVSLARLSRRDNVVTFLRICARKGVEVQLLDGSPSDVEDPTGRLFTGVMATVNEVDSMIKSINVKHGISRRKSAGYYACGSVPFGYIYDGQYARANPETFAEAQQLWAHLEEGEFCTAAVIRRHGYDWSPRGLKCWMYNPMLRGIAKGQEEQPAALITHEQYARMAAIIEGRRTRRARSPRRIRLFSGLISCTSCEKVLGYARPHRLACLNLHCQFYGRGVAEARAREQVIEALRERAEDLAQVADIPAEVAVSQEELARRDQLENLRRMQRDGVPNLEAAIEALELEAIKPVPSGPKWKDLAVLFGRRGTLELSTDEKLRELLLEFVDKLIYMGNPKRIEVRLR